MHIFLFTGGAGYIGSHTAYFFLKNSDCKIVILDDFSTGFRENVEFLQSSFPRRVEFVEGDLGSREILRHLFESYQFSGILHFAGSLLVEESMQKPLLYFQNNVANTILLLQFAEYFNVHSFVFSSTATVYGETNGNKLDEESFKNPINPYGDSKLMVEKILQDLEVANPNFKSVILRYFNVAGALKDKENALRLGNRAKNSTHLIKVACECAVGVREKMQIFGEDYPTRDGTCLRDYIHIDDLASAHFWALKRLMETRTSEIYNVGYGEGFSVKEVVACVKKISGEDFCVELAPRRVGDPSTLVSNNHKILSLTQWRPQYNQLETICESSYLWEKELEKERRGNAV